MDEILSLVRATWDQEAAQPSWKKSLWRLCERAQTFPISAEKAARTSLLTEETSMGNSIIAGGVAHKVPTDLREALNAAPDVRTVWNALTPLARNEWICWVISVKKPETRQKHIERLCAELLEGKRRPCCWPGCPHRMTHQPNHGRGRLKRPLQPMPEFVSESLTTSGLLDRYLQRPPYQQNDYLWWINQAKRQQTKDKRLQQMLDELEAGDCYMGMNWRGPSAQAGGTPEEMRSKQ